MAFLDIVTRENRSQSGFILVILTNNYDNLNKTVYLSVSFFKIWC